MRLFPLTAHCAASMLYASLAIAQVMPPSKPVPELGYRVSPIFLKYRPIGWKERLRESH